jgi:hypothetical protein
MSQRRILSAFLKGVAITPLGGVIGMMIALFAFGALTTPGDDLTFMVVYGTFIGSLFAAPATIVMFPALYAIWPKRTMNAFVWVMGLSAAGGFFSPAAYMLKLYPTSMILEPLHVITGIIGMISAAILAPLYFHWTRRPEKLSEPP